MSHCLSCQSMPRHFQVIISDVEAKSNLSEMVLCRERYIPVYILKAAALIRNSRQRDTLLSPRPTAKRFGNSGLNQQQQHKMLLKLTQSHILTAESHCTVCSSGTSMWTYTSDPTFINTMGVWDCVFSKNKPTGLLKPTDMNIQKVIPSPWTLCMCAKREKQMSSPTWHRKGNKPPWILSIVTREFKEHIIVFPKLTNPCCLGYWTAVYHASPSHLPVFTFWCQNASRRPKLFSYYGNISCLGIICVEDIQNPS